MKNLRVVVKKPYNATKDEIDQSIDAAIRTFKRKVNKLGIIQEVRKREYYLKPGVKRRLKHENYLKQQRKLAKKRGY